MLGAAISSLALAPNPAHGEWEAVGQRRQVASNHQYGRCVCPCRYLINHSHGPLVSRGACSSCSQRGQKLKC
ncbi:hypothetical protein BDW66DRAFT_146456 [Aspergillus desertorum]